MDATTMMQAGYTTECDGCEMPIRTDEIEIADGTLTICTNCVEDPERMDPDLALALSLVSDTTLIEAARKAEEAWLRDHRRGNGPRHPDRYRIGLFI